jgi:putative phosphoserine phosphatase/1-acylglycerol-3-phosphate O-acyltransferase
VPIGLWGTDEVWARSARMPNMTAWGHPPMVTVRVGTPMELDHHDATADTETLMSAIADLLPDASRIQRIPTSEELARTQPPA